MKINEVKELTNKKMKLYKKEQIGSTAIGITSLTLSGLLAICLSVLGTNFIENNNAKLIYVLFTAFVCSVSGSIVFTKMSKIKIKNKEYIKALKALKSELEQGKNRFENINKESFDSEVELYKQLVLKNKEK